MGISDHVEMDDLGHNEVHVFEGDGQDMSQAAVDTLACGPLVIINQPEHIDDIVPDQHALFMRAQTLDGSEYELMFHMGQVLLIWEQTLDVIDRYMTHSMGKLGAPTHLQDDFAQSMTMSKEAMTSLGHIVQLTQLVTRVHDDRDKDIDVRFVDADGDESLDPDERDRARDAAQRVVDMLKDGMDIMDAIRAVADDDGHMPGCGCDKHSDDEG